MSLLLPTDLELNTWRMLWIERDEWFWASLNKQPALSSGDWVMLPCYVFGWGETALPQYQLVLFLRAMARHDLDQLSSLQQRQMLRYAQLWRLTQSWCKTPFFRAMHDTFWCPPQISCLWHRAFMNHCHSINTCESGKVNGIRPRIEQCGMLHPCFYTHPQLILSCSSNNNSPSCALMLPLTYFLHPLCIQASYQTELYLGDLKCPKALGEGDRWE